GPGRTVRDGARPDVRGRLSVQHARRTIVVRPGGAGGRHEPRDGSDKTVDGARRRAPGQGRGARLRQRQRRNHERAVKSRTGAQIMSEYYKPLPKPSPTSRPFWEAARRHELTLQRCGACRAFIYYPRDRCSKCFSDQLAWERVSGRGKVYSFTVVRPASSPPFSPPPSLLAP